ncbi:hypothetical protein PINS_up001118 [Pythium insidiosum]|nr:hypothetical protein PINS_up001118 [Pythium insidiosum]
MATSQPEDGRETSAMRSFEAALRLQITMALKLKCAVAAALGIRASKLVLAQMFPSPTNHEDRDINDLRVSETEFVRAVAPRLERVDVLEDVRRCFKALDLRSEGFISFASFETACRSVLPHLSPQVALSIFREADRDSDGRVSSRLLRFGISAVILRDSLRVAPS